MARTMAPTNDFAVFILTHGRPDNMITIKTLEHEGYNGPLYLIVDNEDSTVDEYKRLYGDKVIVFDKLAASKLYDEGDNFGDRRSILYARNECFRIAEELGYTYFLQLDDDYTQFKYRINAKREHQREHFIVKTKLTEVFQCFLEYYKSIPAQSIAMFQGGDFFGGKDAFGKAKRKCMNTFFCSTERPFQFIGRLNEDVNTYTCYQRRGNMFLSIPFVQVDQLATQQNPGGMSQMYRDTGTYTKAFYTVMYAPSCTKIDFMGTVSRRLHHRIDWDKAVPCIVSESLRKRSNL